MNRREALKRMAFLTGGALSLSTASAIMGGCKVMPGDTFKPQTLSPEQNKMVTVISELIIPETDTPGATEAGVNRFIDKMLTDWNTKEERDHFLKGLTGVNQVSNNDYGKKFLDLNKQQQVELLGKLEEMAITEKTDGNTVEMKPFFSQIKEYTIVGYYTSEIGASVELKYNHVAGYYDGCIPYSEVGRCWTS
ncbi:MAG: gluconate 2-dehydrogenase subunit 3 family protein [Balneolaceae bacterium]|nr:gluconate 2-dehydrogenase subunit 3 family protein [Balneolaceae bacterium]